MLASIQFLRAFAALMVLIHHSFRSTIVNDGLLPAWISKSIEHNFSAGVDIFFVISGFVIYSSVIKNNKSFLDFIKDRICRVVPAYWLYTFIFALVLIFYPWTHIASGVDFWHLVRSLFFIPSDNPSPYAGKFPTLIVGWTLNFEMMFYLVFSMSILFCNKYIIQTCSILMIFVYIISSSNEYLSFYHSTRILEFVCGMWLALLYTKKRNLFSGDKVIHLSIVFISFYILLSSNGDPFISYGIPSIAIVYSSISLESEFNKETIMYHIGNSSYSLYLSHKIVICLMLVVRKHIFISMGSVFMLSIFISILISQISYKYFEVNVTRFLKNKY